MRINRFEDIKTWQEARILTKIVYEATKQKEFYKDRGLREQIQRAAVSVMSNIAEGFCGQSNAEFIQFLGYSRRSSGELQSQLYVALDQKYIDQKSFDNLYEQAKKTAKLVNGFITYLRGSSRKRLVSQTNRQTDELTNRQTD